MYVYRNGYLNVCMHVHRNVQALWSRRWTITLIPISVAGINSFSIVFSQNYGHTKKLPFLGNMCKCI